MQRKAFVLWLGDAWEHAHLQDDFAWVELGFGTYWARLEEWQVSIEVTQKEEENENG